MPKTLLLADDSITIQRVIELTFAGEGISVVAVSDGEHAIARLESAPPDIVLADIGMSGRNGYDIARYVKQSPTLAHVPVLLLTGAFEPIDHARAAEVGCDGVLAKPFEPQLVIARVKELLDRATLQTSAPVAAPIPARDLEPVPTPTSAPVPARVVAEAVPAGAPTNAPAAGSTEAPKETARVDDYFDHLGAAFEALATRAPARPVAPVAAPEIGVADAFAALLAEERDLPTPETRPEWPTVFAPPTVDMDAVVERVTTRVLSQLSDRVVRESVSSLVSTVAERLIVAEIDRIKASIK